VASIIWAWLTAFVCYRRPNYWSVGLVSSFPLAVLFLFKYLSFSLDSLGVPPEHRTYFSFFLSVVLPAGISFYTFEIISYGFDIADGRQRPERKFLPLAIHISFFPQLIAGPILRYEQISKQLERISSTQHIRPNLARGLKYFSVGLFGKIFVADILAAFSKFNFDLATNRSSLDATFSVFAYSFRIYYDFWAYSLMAMGLALMFAIELPRNFVQPYRSVNPRDFWRRWHVTLSFWLRDYVYIRLRGNQRYVRNIVIVFLACGLWHGAGWNFVVWGLYHALLVLGYHYVRGPWDRLPRLLQVGLTFVLISLGWPLFYSDFSQYLQLMTQMFSFSAETAVRFGPAHWAYLTCIAVWTFGQREEHWLYNAEPRQVADWPVLHAGLACAAVLFFSYRETFIYFRF
jgi:alginate O-acetyltransferase complex protein AlgI